MSLLTSQQGTGKHHYEFFEGSGEIEEERSYSAWLMSYFKKKERKKHLMYLSNFINSHQVTHPFFQTPFPSNPVPRFLSMKLYMCRFPSRTRRS